MIFPNYIDNVKRRLASSYDLEEGKLLGEKKLDLFGAFHLRTERYIATKKAVVYGMENHEYICLFHLDDLNQKKLEEYLNWMKTVVDDIVQPHKEHMSSILSLVLICDQAIDEQLHTTIKKTKFHKGYSFGLRGWVDLKLVVCSLRDQSLITNRKGEEGCEIYKQS